MSSGKTETLGLNQWQLSDAFLMEEMNADNRKVDAAVSRKVDFVKLREVTTTVGGVKQIDLDVSDINFGGWQYIVMDTSVNANAFLRVNGSTSANYRAVGGSAVSDALARYYFAPSRTFFLPRRNNADCVYTLSLLSTVLYVGYCVVGWSELHTINLVAESSGTFAAGCKFTLWGVR